MRSNAMKVKRSLLLVLFLLFIPTKSFAAENLEDALVSGTFFPKLVVETQDQKREFPLKVTITSENTKINKKKQVGIDGRNFEYDKKENILGKKKERLAEMAEIRFWSLADGKKLSVDAVKVETLDNVESRITFYNYEKNVSTVVHAFKSNAEIHANKKYSGVNLQKYNNLSGEGNERKWAIEYRTQFTYMIILLSLCPAILVIVLIVFIYIQTQEMGKIIFKKKNKKFMLLLVLPTLFGFGSESIANTIELKEIQLTQAEASRLAEQNQLEDYLIEQSGIKNQLDEETEATVQINTKQITANLNQPRTQYVEVYKSRTLIIGDYETYIIQVIVFYCLLTVLPLIYFWNKRFKSNE